MNQADDILRVLRIDASSRQEGSVTRYLTQRFIDELRAECRLGVQTRDVSQGLPFIDQDWISASYTPAEQRSDKQNQVLALSDSLIQELSEADVLVIGSPLYNFSVPASLKAWIDQVARVGKTFRYGASGPEGLLQDKKAYIVLATGGTEIGSSIDYASGYLRQVLGFIGIDDVTLIGAERLNLHSDTALSDAEQQIQQAVAGLQYAA